jgi:hypothetical protein
MTTAMLKREVATPSGSMFGKLILGSFVVGVLASPFFAPRTMKMCDRARLDVHVGRHQGDG